MYIQRDEFDHVSNSQSLPKFVCSHILTTPNTRLDLNSIQLGRHSALLSAHNASDSYGIVELDWQHLFLSHSRTHERLQPVFLSMLRKEGVSVDALCVPGVANKIRDFLFTRDQFDYLYLHTNNASPDMSRMLMFSRVTGINFVRLVDFGFSEQSILQQIQSEWDSLVPFYSGRLHYGKPYGDISPAIIPRFISMCKTKVQSLVDQDPELHMMHAEITDSTCSAKRSMVDDVISSPKKKFRCNAISSPAGAKRSYTSGYVYMQENLDISPSRRRI